MAEIAHVPVPTARDGPTVLLLWEAMANPDTGTPYLGLHRPDKTVVVQGTFGGTVTIQGSAEATPTTWVTLNDTQGSPLTFTANGARVVQENTTWIRPIAGTGVVDVDVYLVASSSRSRAG